MDLQHCALCTPLNSGESSLAKSCKSNCCICVCLFVCMLFAFLLCSGLCVAVQLSWTSRSARLQYTIANLRRSLEWSGSDKDWPLPQRLPRRAWRVSYLKRPFRAKISIRTALRSTLLVKAQQDEAYEPECRAFWMSQTLLWETCLTLYLRLFCGRLLPHVFCRTLLSNTLAWHSWHSCDTHLWNGRLPSRKGHSGHSVIMQTVHNGWPRLQMATVAWAASREHSSTESNENPEEQGKDIFMMQLTGLHWQCMTMYFALPWSNTRTLTVIPCYPIFCQNHTNLGGQCGKVRHVQRNIPSSCSAQMCVFVCDHRCGFERGVVTVISLALFFPAEPEHWLRCSPWCKTMFSMFVWLLVMIPLYWYPEH